ncbi:MFS transporter [Burkholderia perseverans]|uniref:MFS transporter n=1 Tax=Burkholderia perseverans TaxID=2615214 RepID=UPI001FEE468A|nr:MFS transporter [Burkholderia perseverans]
MRRFAAFLLFSATLLAASGYGATFLLSGYYRVRGGGDLDTGATLGAAMLGTFVGVPLVGWFSARFDAARMSALACCAIAAGFAWLAGTAGLARGVSLAAGLLIGLGWGMFYLGAPLALSERIADHERARWFSHFGAFQMAGIGGSPVALQLAVQQAGLPMDFAFRLVGAGCLLAAAALWRFGLHAPHAPRSRAVRAWLRPLAVIARGAALRPILMAGCGACVFSGLLTFQSSLVAGTAAPAAVFYAVNACTVVAARLLLGRVLASLPPRPLAAGLLVAMALGVAAMFAVAVHPAFQIVSAMLVGVGYGLVYSLIQTRAVNDAPAAFRHAALTWFVLSYFVGVFGFPVLGAWLLVHCGRGALLGVLLLAALLELSILLAGARGDGAPHASHAARRRHAAGRIASAVPAGAAPDERGRG